LNQNRHNGESISTGHSEVYLLLWEPEAHLQRLLLSTLPSTPVSLLCVARG
jgi:hypothetical protein